jgi:hypothetical protein
MLMLMKRQENYIRAEAAELRGKLKYVTLFGQPADLSDPDILLLAAYHLGIYEEFDRHQDTLPESRFGRMRMR